MLDDGSSYSLTSSIDNPNKKQIDDAMNILLQELQLLLVDVKDRLKEEELEAYRRIFKELEQLKNK